ncbi:hypothetical protein NDU88_003497 [Pleurodeles waltl]|uniref:Uncharacterized protein n=1 Tax=Pleurodeles waltl TaxID=8319 RepID=A0AAV7WSZ1_PLEWA|nr:hypothetical protein NDU88_003497 [Pleurodeles waltl]
MYWGGWLHSSPNTPAPRLPLHEFFTGAVAGAEVEQRGSAAANSCKRVWVCGSTVLLLLLELSLRSGTGAGGMPPALYRCMEAVPILAPASVGSAARSCSSVRLAAVPALPIHPSIRILTSGGKYSPFVETSIGLAVP